MGTGDRPDQLVTTESGQPAADRRLTDRVTLAGQSIAVVVVLLPAVGAFVRYFALMADDNVSHRMRVALARPVPALAAMGVVAVMPAAVLFGYLLAAERWLNPYLRRRRAAKTPGRKATIGAVLLMVFTFLLAAVLLATGPFPMFPIAVVLSLVAILISHRLRHLPANIWTRWPCLIPLLASSIVIGVGNGGGIGYSPSEYVFATKTQIPNGIYIDLGEADGVRYLRSCVDGDERVRVVRVADVLSETMAKAARPPESSLWSIIRGTGELQLGVVYACPDRTVD
jgi:hypothetical protein